MEKRIGKLTCHILFFQVSVAWMLSYPSLSLSLSLYGDLYARGGEEREREAAEGWDVKTGRGLGRAG